MTKQAEIQAYHLLQSHDYSESKRPQTAVKIENILKITYFGKQKFTTE